MTLNRRVAIYAGTFDPLTLGHEDLVRRAVNLFDHVIVAIAESRAKRPFFTLEEREEMAKEVLAPYPNAEVCSFDGLLMNFLHERGAKVILRGLRAASDFEYEFQMALMNRTLRDDIETVFLAAREEYTYLSSRIIKEVARLGGDVSGMVPAPVAEALPGALGRNAGA